MEPAVGLPKHLNIEFDAGGRLLTADSRVEPHFSLKGDLLVDVEAVTVDLIVLGLSHRFSTTAY
jgi:hypothetical protein